jgi:hypothetical protein
LSQRPLATKGCIGFLFGKDSVLEWGEFAAYVSAVTIAIVAVPRLWRADDLASASAVVGLAAIALVSGGEELSWGQRVFGFETPEILAENRQGESTVHNDPRVEGPARVALLLAGLYGSLVPLLLRRSTPFVPPRASVTFFAVVATYFAIRLIFLEHPTYVEAKYSEWPETCFALGVAIWCAQVAGVRLRVGPKR